jgi:hypothetical protein
MRDWSLFKDAMLTGGLALATLAYLVVTARHPDRPVRPDERLALATLDFADRRGVEKVRRVSCAAPICASADWFSEAKIGRAGSWGARSAVSIFVRSPVPRRACAGAQNVPGGYSSYGQFARPSSARAGEGREGGFGG